jgi:hypothetical protein
MIGMLVDKKRLSATLQVISYRPSTRIFSYQPTAVSTNGREFINKANLLINSLKRNAIRRQVEAPGAGAT